MGGIIMKDHNENLKKVIETYLNEQKRKGIIPSRDDFVNDVITPLWPGGKSGRPDGKGNGGTTTPRRTERERFPTQPTEKNQPESKESDRAPSKGNGGTTKPPRRTGKERFTDLPTDDER